MKKIIKYLWDNVDKKILISSSYYRNHALIAFYDVTDEISFETISGLINLANK